MVATEPKDSLECLIDVRVKWKSITANGPKNEYNYGTIVAAERCLINDNETIFVYLSNYEGFCNKNTVLVNNIPKAKFQDKLIIDLVEFC